MNVFAQIDAERRVSLVPGPAPAVASTAIVEVLVPPERQPALACFVRRTYAIESGRLALADVQEPLTEHPVAIVDDESGSSWLDDDGDLVATKPATDVVLRGAAVSRRPTRELIIAIAVGASVRRLRVIGPRTAEIGSGNKLRFSDPAPFERCELTPTLAYGGQDLHAQNQLERAADGRALGELPEDLRPTRAAWLYQYPRNPVGRGFFIDTERERADGTQLPQIEDPADVLTPERLFLKSPLAWLGAPLPGMVSWMEHSWYPRCARLMGIAPDHEELPANAIERDVSFSDGGDLAEIRRSKKLRFHPRALQGAAPGLAAERLRGDEMILLENVHPKHESLKLALPGEQPRMRLSLPALKTYEPAVSLQTVRIDTERDRVSLTWSGSIRLMHHAPADFVRGCNLDVTWRKG